MLEAVVPRVLLLGPVELQDSSAHKRSPSGRLPPRERALLARLAIDAGRVVAVERLVDDLWGEDPPNGARNTLQVYVSHLRRRLGPELIASHATGYRLTVEPDAVDAYRFERLIATASRLTGTDQRGHAGAALNQALGLWRGEPLADLNDYEFARLEATRLTELRATAVQDLAENELALGHHDRVVTELGPLVHEFPFRERLRGAVMTGLYRQGRAGDALELYRDGQALLREELGLDPGPALQALQAAILAGDAELVAVPQTHNLGAVVPPAPAATLLGRKAESAAIADLLSDPMVRLLSVLGTGGAGKTRLAIEIANDPPSAFAAATVWVPLVGLDDGAGAVSAICEALRLPPKKQFGIAQIAAALDGGPALLVLDNAEHLLPGIAATVTDLLAECPQLTMLVTTRVALRVDGERRFILGPLPVPSLDDDLIGLTANAAVRLFTERAAQVRPGFEVDAANAAAVAAICVRLDGLPLAIELAAARAGLLEPAAMLSRLESRLGLVTSRPGDAGDRHRSLRQMLDWSYRLLSPAAAQLFAALGAFRGGFTLDAVEQVDSLVEETAVADRSAERGHLIDAIQELVDASMVLSQEGGRLFMLETVAEYAREKLTDSAREQHVRDAHCEYFRSEVLQRRPGFPQPPANVAEWDWYLAERGNLRAATLWAQRRGQPAALADLATKGFVEANNPADWPLVEQWLQEVALDPETGVRRVDAELILAGHLAERGSFDELWGHLERALHHLEAADADDPGRLAKVLAKHNYWAHHAGKELEAARYADRAIAAAEATSDLAVRASVLLSVYPTDPETVRQLQVRAMDIATAAGTETSLLRALINLAELDLTDGDAEQALRWCHRATRVPLMHRQPRYQAFNLNIMAGALLVTGDVARARPVLRAAVRSALHVDLSGLIAESVLFGAAMAAFSGDKGSAAIFLGSHNEIMRSLGQERVDSSATIYDCFLADLDEHLDHHELQQRLQFGASLTMEQLRDWLLDEQQPIFEGEWPDLVATLET